MLLKQIVDPALSQYAYLVGCQRSGEAILIDPERDLDRYLRIAAENDLKIVAVAETHIHADYLSGARELVERHGATAYLSAEGGEDWQSEWAKGHDRVRFLRDGDSFKIGNIGFEAMYTPGHTPEHLSFVVTDHGGGADQPMAIFSGDFIFVGDVGRPDLLESAAGQAGAMEPSARVLYETLRSTSVLPEFLQVLPAHGAGSACGKALGAIPASTMGYERRFNRALASALESGEGEFVKEILSGQPEPPPYFARMQRDNRLGPALLKGGALPRPRRISAPDLPRWVDTEGTAILDLRSDRKQFLALAYRRNIRRLRYRGLTAWQPRGKAIGGRPPQARIRGGGTWRREHGSCGAPSEVMGQALREPYSVFGTICQTSQIWLRSGNLEPKRSVWPR
jgi:hydroxyacylglutathione hydrolase